MTARPSLKKLDGRSREARYRRDLRAELMRHVGNAPSATQEVLIDIAVDTAFEIEAMKARRGDDGTLSLHDHRAMLAYQNTLRRTMTALGIKGAAQRGPDHAAVMAEKARQKAAGIHEARAAA
ncbi:MAG TPA: hypothetical protein VL997_12755 [Dyella sp.]|nr:hypothetical protein [Dyella sp.]